MKCGVGCPKHGILIGSPGMRAGRTIGGPVGFEESEHFFGDALLGGRLWDGFEGQIGVFKAKMDGTIQTEFEEDFIFRANTQWLMPQDLEELVLETQGEIVGELTFGLNAQDFIEVIGQGAQRPMGIHIGTWRDGEVLIMGGQVDVPEKPVASFFG